MASASSSDQSVQHLLEIGLQLIDTSWTKEVWDQDFVELTCGWPNDVPNESAVLEGPLLGLLEVCRTWTVGEDSSSGFWMNLHNNEMSHHSLVAFLFCIMETYPKHEVGVYAADIYLQLNRLPGSSAYKVFHSLLFEKATNFIRLLTLGSNKAKKTTAPTRRGQRGVKAGRKGARAVVVAEEDSDNDSMEQEEDSSAAASEAALKASLVLLQDLVGLMDEFSLKASEHCLQQLIVLLVELTRGEGHVTLNWNMSKQQIRGCSSVVQLAYKMLASLCSAFHGAPSASVLLAFKQLKSNLVMDWSSVQSSTALPQRLLATADCTVQFIVHMLCTSQPVALPALTVLLQHVCVDVPTRSDFRTRIAQVVRELINYLPVEELIHMRQWIHKYAKSNKTPHRVFAMDVIVQLLQHPSDAARNGDLPAGEDANALDEQFLLRLMFARCSDKAASVRAHALSALSDIGRQLSNHFQRLLRDETEAGPGPTHSSIFIPMLIRRCGDEKVIVRRSVLQLLEVILSLEAAVADTEVVQALRDRCRDPALSVRKQALASLSSVLDNHRNQSNVQRLWLEAVLPLVMDRETSVKQRCCQLMHDSILSFIESSRQASDEQRQLAWDLLTHISCRENHEMRCYFQRVVTEWSRDGRLSSGLLRALLAEIDGAHSKAAWMLLGELAPHCKLPNVSKFMGAFKQSSSSDDLESILAVLSASCCQLPAEDAKALQDDLIRRILQFSADVPLTNSMLTALAKVAKHVGVTSGDQEKISAIGKHILQKCQVWLTETLLQPKEKTDIDEGRLISHLFTLGEVAQICPAHVTEQQFLLVQSLLLPPDDTQITCKSALSSQVRAHAFVTLGKLCLQQHDLAKKCVVVLVRELETGTDPVVRNNIVIILCDLCVRYTQLVDRYLPSISACLIDESPLVCHQTLTAITHLLQEDYIKWKGPLFFRYLMCIVSDNAESCQFAEFCLVHLLLARHQILFVKNFVETLFYFNAYVGHATYNKYTQAAGDKSRFSLQGAKNKEKRMTIYRFLLRHMSDEQRFNITEKLCQEILSDVIEKSIPLGEEGSAVLHDALHILSCSEIKLSALRTHPVDEMDDEAEQVNTLAANVKSKVVSQVLRKNVIENIMPTVINLKHLLEQKRSPLLRDLMHFLRELMKDYRHEVQDILSADRQLAREIEFDLRKLESDEKKEAAAAKEAATNQRAELTPHARLMSPLLNSPITSTPRQITTPMAGFSAPRLRQTPALSLRKHVLQSRGSTPAVQGKTPMSAGSNATPTTRRTQSAYLGSPVLMPPPGAIPASAQTTTPQTRHPETPAAPSSAGHSSTLSMSAGPHPLARAVSTPQHSAVGISFREPLSGLIPPSPILPISRLHSHRSNQQTACRTADGRPMVSIPSPDQPLQPLKKWSVSSQATQRSSGRPLTQVNSPLATPLKRVLSVGSVLDEHRPEHHGRLKRSKTDGKAAGRQSTVTGQAKRSKPVPTGYDSTSAQRRSSRRKVTSDSQTSVNISSDEPRKSSRKRS